jgi:RNA polymerase subunit RPABC4/transcription elongation factor Spt4/5-methylcytosine-specific restriction endonuclease McrA
MIFTKEELALAVANSLTIRSALTKLGCQSNQGHYYKVFHKLCQEYGIDYTHFNPYNAQDRSRKPLRLEANTHHSSHDLKKRLVREGLLEYRCLICGNAGEWQERQISLQLDHINGIHTDNRLENLRILCPNCHAQTETFGNKRKKIVKLCKVCKIKINKQSTFCRFCVPKTSSQYQKRYDIPREELLSCSQGATTYSEITKRYGISANGIKRRIKSMKLVVPKFNRLPAEIVCRNCGIKVPYNKKLCTYCSSEEKDALKVSLVDALSSSASIREAADKLGVDHSTIIRRSRRLGINYKDILG